MDAKTIACPECGTEIEITKALSDQIGGQIRKDYEAKSGKKEAELKKKEAELAKERKKLEEQKDSVDRVVQEQVLKEKSKLKATAKKEAEQALSLEIKDMQEQADEQKKKIDNMEKQELELRKKAREAEEIKKNAELEIARRVDEEKNKAILDAKKQFEEVHHLKDKDKDQVIEDMKNKIKELNQKAEQGSMERQGEVFEQDLEERLRLEFRFDNIDPVLKGASGADLLQSVFDGRLNCGTIIWEAKRTKNWSNGWIEKLREDQHNAKADIAIIITNALPKEIDSFGQIEGIWVTDYSSALNLASALRTNIIQLAHARRASEGKNEKMDILYSYLTSPEFSQKVEALVRSFNAMEEGLRKEQNSLKKIWANREKQIEIAKDNTIKMFGNMQAVIGTSLPDIKFLEMPEDED